MPEENSNIQQAPARATDIAPGTPAPDPEPEIRYASADTIDQPDPGAGASEENDESGQVPSFRLREESTRRREAEQSSVVLQQQNQLLQNQLAIAQQNPTAPVPAAEADPNDELRRPFGTDQDGDTAYNAVKNVSRAEAREEIATARKEMRQELQADFDVKLGSVTASMAMAEELAGMKVNGLIDDGAEKEIGRRMGEQIRQNPAWGQPANQRHLLNQIWTDMLRNGDIRPTTRPATPGGGGNSPLQPGAPRLTERQVSDNNDAELLEIQRRHPGRFGKLSLDELRSLGGPGTSQHQAGPAQEAQGQPTRTFIHTR
tara:strand:+ start:1115 stop:2062 length:948 start_codon:yes stop_codon:yes gene_type:complete